MQKLLYNLALIFFLVTFSRFNYCFADDAKDIKILKILIKNNNLGAFKAAVENDLNIHVKDERGHNALKWSLDFQFLDIAIFLVENKIESEFSYQGINSVLWWSIINEKFDLTKSLIRNGANVNLFNMENRVAPLTYFASGRENIGNKKVVYI